MRRKFVVMFFKVRLILIDVKVSFQWIVIEFGLFVESVRRVKYVVGSVNFCRLVEVDLWE